MRVAIDVQTIGRRRTGDETYYRGLISHYGSLRPDNEYFYYYTRSEAEPFLKGLGGISRPRRIRPSAAFLRIPLLYPWQMLKERVDVFHTQYVGIPFGGAKLVLTVHDLSFEHYPDTFRRDRAWLLKLTRWSANNASAVITVSESTKRDLMNLYGIADRKIHVIYNAAGEEFVPCVDESRLARLRESLGIRKNYFLFVGAFQPRKNLGRLLAAFHHARRRPNFDCQLVIVGAHAWGRSSVPAEGRDVVAPGYLDAGVLPALYSGAMGLIYPSLYEGFGLPAVEAMSCGTPVIASSSSCLPEICGQAAVYVDPFSEEDITRAMWAIHDHPQLRVKLREDGLRRARLFSWRESARRTLEVYEKVNAS
ncbi:MAG: glycosyltransferase family 1 protein [Elusimicrobiota bacterium]